MFFAKPLNKKAVAYYRHSAEDKQENSVVIQRTHTQKFAAVNNIEIIHEVIDEGKSGLSANRPGFDELFKEFILNPNAPPFDYVLVYDVSRWGRFQDQDEAAFWEYWCKDKGKQVIYVSKGFLKEENQLLSHLQISIERYMAAEYSRALGEKVFHGSVKVSEQGFSAGGTAPYGMVRVLFDETKKPVRILKHGEHKVISNQRVTFAPANDKTTQVVKTVFSLYVNERYPTEKIADYLNTHKFYSPTGGLWNNEKIVRILTNETYTGSRVYNKTWHRLKQKQRANPTVEWVICKNAFEAIVTPEIFQKAQEHLYWSSPHKWKQGVYLINCAQKRFKNDLKEFLENRLRIDEDRLWHALHNFPMVVAATFYRKGSIPCWCFTVREQMKQYRNILCISIESNLPDRVELCFLIPTQDFGTGNFFVLSDQHPRYRDYLLDADVFEEKILALCKNL